MIDGSNGQVKCECGECDDTVSMEEFIFLFDLKENVYNTMETWIQKKNHSPWDEYHWLEEYGELVLCMVKEPVDDEVSDVVLGGMYQAIKKGEQK